MASVFNSGDTNAPARRIQQRTAAQPVIQSADGIIEAQGCKHGWISNGPIIGRQKILRHSTDADLILNNGNIDFIIGGTVFCENFTVGRTINMGGTITAERLHEALNASHYLELPTEDPETLSLVANPPAYPYFEFTIVADPTQTATLQVSGANVTSALGAFQVPANSAQTFRFYLWNNAGTPEVFILPV